MFFFHKCFTSSFIFQQHCYPSPHTIRAADCLISHGSTLACSPFPFYTVGPSSSRSPGITPRTARVTLGQSHWQRASLSNSIVLTLGCPEMPQHKGPRSMGTDKLLGLSRLQTVATCHVGQFKREWIKMEWNWKYSSSALLGAFQVLIATLMWLVAAVVNTVKMFS